MIHNNGAKEGKESFLCSFIILRLYRLIESQAFRSLFRNLVLRMEGGPVYSLTIREKTLAPP